MKLALLPFREKIREGAVLIDVRSPAEYHQGHIPGAVNMPLFTNEERAEVGTLYVRVGRDKAIDKGLEFVGPRMALMVKEARQMARKAGAVALYCWRGGMRSSSVGWLLHTAGITTYVLEGGYKNYREEFRILMSEQPWRFNVLGGYTGSGKTTILQLMAEQGAQVIDLEGLANHRGSAFGSLGQADQPTTEMFINWLHEILLTLDSSHSIWVEGESNSIGRVYLPPELTDKMNIAHFYFYKIPFEVRLQRILMEYGKFPPEVLISSFENIAKRLGYDRAKEAIEALHNDSISQAAEIALHYYDRAYEKSIQRHEYPHMTMIESMIDDPIQIAERLINSAPPSSVS